MSDITDQTMLGSVVNFLKTQNRVANYLALKRGPYFLAIQGVQGSGKTTLAQQLAEILRAPPWSLSTVIVSIDDFYLTNKDQTELATKFRDNPLIQHRGQPSTHDLTLWGTTFECLRQGQPTAIPQYDKSCFNGKGDRVQSQHWEKVNEDVPIQVVIFEGWSVGFSALSDAQVKSTWETARRSQHDHDSVHTGQLAYHKLEDLLFVNNALREEDRFCEYFQDLVQIESRLENVYKWRLQQETVLRATKGSGMTDEQVKEFIDGYYPSYELYTEGLSNGDWRRNTSSDWRQQHVRLQVDDERQVQGCLVL